MPNYLVRSYDPTKSVDLINILAELSGSPPSVFRYKHLTQYLIEYVDALLGFKGSSKATFVIERPYIDRDFLVDFQEYYVRCHWPYERYCSRIHLFDMLFDGDELTSLLQGKVSSVSEKQLQRHYLGFVVVKKLPEALIGKSCLKTYPKSPGNRSFGIVRDYSVNLFGIPLSVRSLAFQEQDSVVAACATSALWSAFHFTSSRFQHYLPSPVEITEQATTNMPRSTRALPSSGLTLEQMARAISHFGLEPEYLSPFPTEPIEPNEDWLFKAILYGYLKQGCTPPLIGVELVSPQKPGTSCGYHAITAAGFRTKGAAKPVPGTEFLLTSSRLVKFYAHDDQVGPFSRIEFDGTCLPVKHEGKLKDHIALKTTWPGTSNCSGEIRFVPKFVLLPIYHKIRIPVTIVLDEVNRFDEFLRWVSDYGNIREAIPLLEWDVYLCEVGDLKSDIRGIQLDSPAFKSRFLLASLPRYIWRAIGRSGRRRVLEIDFDATDFPSGHYCKLVIPYDTQVFEAIRDLAKHDIDQRKAIAKKATVVLQAFRESL